MKILKHHTKRGLSHPCMQCRDLVVAGEDYAQLIIYNRVRERHVWVTLHLDCIGPWLRALKPRQRTYKGKQSLLRLTPEQKKRRASLNTLMHYYQKLRRKAMADGCPPTELPHDTTIDTIHRDFAEAGGIPKRWRGY